MEVIIQSSKQGSALIDLRNEGLALTGIYQKMILKWLQVGCWSWWEKKMITLEKPPHPLDLYACYFSLYVMFPHFTWGAGICGYPSASACLDDSDECLMALMALWIPLNPLLTLSVIKMFMITASCRLFVSVADMMMDSNPKCLSNNHTKEDTCVKIICIMYISYKNRKTTLIQLTRNCCSVSAVLQHHQKWSRISLNQWRILHTILHVQVVFNSKELYLPLSGSVK